MRRLDSLSQGLRLYAAAGDDFNHHWLTMLNCVPGGLMHDVVLRFVNGTLRREDSPLLMRICARWRFALVVERWIEGRHALMKALLRPVRHASAVHIAYTQCLRKLLSMCEADADFIHDLADCCSRVRNANEAVTDR